MSKIRPKTNRPSCGSQCQVPRIELNPCYGLINVAPDVIDNFHCNIAPIVNANQKKHIAHRVEQLRGLIAKYVVRFRIFVKIVRKNYENTVSEI